MHTEDLLWSHVGVLAEALTRGSDPFPPVLEIHPSWSCNHSCTYCFNRGTTPPELEELAADQWFVILQEARSLGVRLISVSGGGEPFASPVCAEILRECQRLDLEYRVVTNGTLCGENDVNLLLGAAEVRVSLDAATPETYQRIRGVGLAEYRSAKRLVKEVLRRREANGPRPMLGTSFVVCEENKHEIEIFRSLMHDLGVDCVLFKRDINDLQLGTSFEQSRCGGMQGIEWRLDAESARHREHGCYMSSLRVAVDPSGLLFGCCLKAQQSETAGALGDVRLHGLRDIWVGTTERRDRWRRERPSCRTCNYVDALLNAHVASALASDALGRGNAGGPGRDGVRRA